MSDRGFSIDLGPELDPPYAREWGYIDENLPPSSTMRAKGRRSIKALARQYERVVSRKKRGPKHIPARPLPTEHEATGEPEPVRVLSPMEVFETDISLDALQEIAEQKAERHAA